MRIPKREFTLENLQVYAEWVSDIFRQDDLFKDGWSEGIVNNYTLSPDWDYADLSKVAKLNDVELLCRWGLDEEGYRQEWYQYINYDSEEQWLSEYDRNFSNDTTLNYNNVVQLIQPKEKQ
jgi:hypothetical protein